MPWVIYGLSCRQLCDITVRRTILASITELARWGIIIINCPVCPMLPNAVQ
jgi:hypothetical protein